MATLNTNAERGSPLKNAKEFCCIHLGRVITQFYLAHKKILVYSAIPDLNKLIKEPTKQLLTLTWMCFSVSYISFIYLYISWKTEIYYGTY